MDNTEERLKRALDELNRVQKRLRELEAVFEHCNDGISIVNKSGVIVSSNPAMQRILNLARDQYVGKSVADLVKLRTFSTNVSARVISDGRPFTALQEISSGTRCVTTGVPIKGEDGRVEMVVVNSRDVTELYSLKESLIESQKIAGGYEAELTDMRITQMKHEDIVVRSKKMLDILDLARRLASVDSTVIITGESGAGKEVVATLLHRASPRRSRKSFIKVNCGAIPRDLLESELFGYEYGAFTGAAREGRAGLFELADGGSIFLDEITELPPDLQVKLLRVLQDREFTRIGGSRVVRVDVRVIAASNNNIPDLVALGKFRKDLYYRLNVVPLEVPPLRDRKEDILALAQHYLRHFNIKYGFDKVLSADLISLMEEYSWPGNVRELINVVERMTVTSKDFVLRAEEFPLKNSMHPREEVESVSTPGAVRMRDILEEKEKKEKSAVLNVLQNSPNITAAAQSLGISRATLVRRMRKYGIKRDSPRYM